MRFATWNINNIKLRLPLLLAWLDATKPDVVALQELKSTTKDFPTRELEQAGYGALVVGQKTWNGVALLARDVEPILVRRSLPGDSTDRQARYVEGAINGVIVTSIYAPNGNPFPGDKFAYKLAWFERLTRHAAELLASGHPVVLAGDYNVVPTPRDIYVSSSWDDNALIQPEARAGFEKLLKQGRTDSVRRQHPKEPMYSFWDYRRNRWERDAGLRIDHLLVSKALTAKLRGAGVDRAVRAMEGASDHAPVWMDLAI
ncbi:MAG: exodeoxyribonuclease III [Burkholderiales bacterium]